jgi:hypothetical protein
VKIAIPRRRTWTIVLLTPALLAAAAPGDMRPRVGDTYEITRDVASSESSDGSEGNTHDLDVFVERVAGVRGEGLELEYDIKDATPQDREIAWQFPFRVLKPASGLPILLNAAELQARADRYLKRAKLPHSACGRWYFTWTAFRIECDSQSVLQILASLDLGAIKLSDGSLYRDSGASASAPLVRKTTGPSGSTFVVEMTADPAAVQRDRAQTDVVVAEVSGKSLTLDAALRARSSEHIAGTIRITFDTDSIGQVRRRTKVTKLEITGPSGRIENRTVTEIVERRLVSPSAGGPLPVSR